MLAPSNLLDHFAISKCFKMGDSESASVSSYKRLKNKKKPSNLFEALRQAAEARNVLQLNGLRMHGVVGGW